MDEVKKLEKVKELKEKKSEKSLVVVEQLPTQQLRVVTTEDGDEYECLTRDEALTEILKIVRKLEKGML